MTHRIPAFNMTFYTPRQRHSTPQPASNLVKGPEGGSGEVVVALGGRDSVVDMMMVVVGKNESRSWMLDDFGSDRVVAGSFQGRGDASE